MPRGVLHQACSRDRRRSHPHSRIHSFSSAMGQRISLPPPPPNSLCCEIEKAECNCQGRKWDRDMAKPSQAAGWSESRWSDFNARMHALVRSFKGEIIPCLMIPMLFIIVWSIVDDDTVEVIFWLRKGGFDHDGG